MNSRTIQYNHTVDYSDLSGSRASYVDKFHPADLPQQNSKTSNAQNQYRKGQ